MSEDGLWYKDAVFYELHVRSYQDGDNDGIGDFRGLTSRLDYLQDLGVDCIWLLPFYESPLRDDGYDIADYETINPSYGTMRDFRAFVDEAHKRGLRVVTELVFNHTSYRRRTSSASDARPESRISASTSTNERNFSASSANTPPIARPRIVRRTFSESDP